MSSARRTPNHAGRQPSSDCHRTGLQRTGSRRCRPALCAFDEERITTLDLPFALAHARDEEEFFRPSPKPAGARGRSCCGSVRRTGPRPSTTRQPGRIPGLRAALLRRSALGHQPGRQIRLRQAERSDLEAGWAGIAKKWPSAEKAISKFTLGNDEMDAMLIAVERDGKTVEASSLSASTRTRAVDAAGLSRPIGRWRTSRAGNLFQVLATLI